MQLSECARSVRGVRLTTAVACRVDWPPVVECLCVSSLRRHLGSVGSMENPVVNLCVHGQTKTQLDTLSPSSAKALLLALPCCCRRFLARLSLSCCTVSLAIIAIASK